MIIFTDKNVYKVFKKQDYMNHVGHYRECLCCFLIEKNLLGYLVSKASWFVSPFCPGNVEYAICTAETGSSDLQNQAKSVWQHTGAH